MFFLRDNCRIIFFLCLLFSSSLYPETVGITLLQHPKTKKKIAIINDRHTDVGFPQLIDETAQSYLQEQSRQVQSLFGRLKEQKIKTTVAVELPIFSWSTQQWQNIGRVLGDSQKNIYENGWDQGAVSYCSFDERSNDDLIIQDMGIRNKFNYLQKIHEKCKQEERDVPYLFTGPKVDLYVEQVKNKCTYLCSWVEVIDAPERVKRELIDKISQDGKKLVAYLQDHKNENITMYDCFLKLGEHEYEQLSIASFNAMLHACDITLLCSVLDTKNDKVVVHGGLLHGALLHERLVECGFTQKDSKFCMKLEKEGPYGYKTPQQIPRNISDIILTFFSDSASIDNIEAEWDEVITVNQLG